MLPQPQGLPSPILPTLNTQDDKILSCNKFAMTCVSLANPTSCYPLAFESIHQRHFYISFYQLTHHKPTCPPSLLVIGKRHDFDRFNHKKNRNEKVLHKPLIEIEG